VGRQSRTRNSAGRALTKPFTFEQKAYLIPQNDPAMQQWIDEWLNIAQNDGTYAAISQKWMGQVVVP
jgi:cyclohexadienyl dehydratase